MDKIRDPKLILSGLVRFISSSVRRLLSRWRDYWGYGLAALLLAGLVLITPGRQDNRGKDEEQGKNNPLEMVLPHFRDQTLAAGLTFSHLQGDEHLTGLNEVLGPGACAFDYDNDGWVDLFLVNGTGQTRYYGSQHWWHLPKGHALYRNTGGGQFQDVSKISGFKHQSWGMGCVTGDLDNDGDADLLVTNYGKNLLYRNNGDGSFSDITAASGISGEAWSTSAALADYDGDGLLDIYIANYVHFTKGAHTYEAGSQFTEDVPPAFDPSLYNAQSNRLYRNLGGLRFEESAQTAGVVNESGRSLAAVWLHVNDDDWPDLFVANDKGTPNALFINLGNGKFRAGGTETGLSTTTSSLGVSSGDINGDSKLDLAVGSDLLQPPLLLIRSDKKKGDEGFAGIHFSDLARAAGVGTERDSNYSGWSPSAQDFNNDGRLDLFMANGQAVPDVDAPKVPQGQPNQLWLNNGDIKFKNISTLAGAALQDRQSARGSAAADFDNDGDIDIYIAHNNELGQLLINDAPAQHWLGIRLQGGHSNKDAIGARVWLQTANGTQYRELSAGQGFLSDSDRRLHFGLGQANEVIELRVRWPDGSTDRYSNIPTDRYIKLTQGKSNFSKSPTSGPATTKPALKLRLGANHPIYRIQYLNWLVSDASLTKAMPELVVAISDENPAVRHHVIDILTDNKHPDGLKLLVKALDDPDSNNRTAAVSAIRVYEDEASVRWLLRKFQDPAPAVRAATANAFAFFYREEEAVIHRKYLAIPYLIRLLEDEDSTVAVSAIRALGNAERYRGVDPLINQLSSASARLRAEAARALGLIRERKAIAALLRLLDQEHQPPQVHAHILIALKRLAYKNTQTRLNNLFSNSSIRDATKYKAHASHALRVIKAFLQDPDDGVVFSVSQLVQLVTHWLDSAAGSPILSDSRQEELAQLTVDTLAASHSRRAISWLKKFTRYPRENIRTSAYLALMAIDSKQLTKYASDAIADKSMAVRHQVLTMLDSMNTKIPVRILLPILKNKETRLPAIALAPLYHDQSVVRQLHAIAINSGNSVNEREAALLALSTMPLKKPDLPMTIRHHSEVKLRQSALRYWASRLPLFVKAYELPQPLSEGLQDDSLAVRLTTIDILLARHEAWAKAAIEHMLIDENAELALRKRCLNKLIQSWGKGAIRPILVLARSRYDPLSHAAIEKLVDVDDPAVEQFMWQLLKNKQEHERVRFLAAKALQRRHSSAIRAFLQS